MSPAPVRRRRTAADDWFFRLASKDRIEADRLRCPDRYRDAIGRYKYRQRTGRATGLSNAPNRAASERPSSTTLALTPVSRPPLSTTLTLRAVCRPASVTLRVQDEIGVAMSKRHAFVGGQGGRKPIREFSDKARRNLRLTCADLQALGEAPEWMLTLTLPAEWESVVPNGRELKRLKKLFDKRMRRWCARQGIELSALWFLEFQERGAPHFHYLLWQRAIAKDHASTLSESLRRDFIRWVSIAWADVVSHPDPVERVKHEAAGTRVERMRKPHFGYAMAYASKPRQKVVPDEFQDVGRFWGLMNYQRPAPIKFWFEDRVEVVKQFVEAAVRPLAEHSERFAGTVRRLFSLFFEVDNRWTDRHYFGGLAFTAFGSASSLAVLSSPGPSCQGL